MACCIIAAILLAQLVAMIRRWGIFWGVVTPRPGEHDDTIYRRLRNWLARPVVRRALTLVALVEVGLLGAWTYVEHGNHIYREADQFVGALRGQQVIYAGLCSPDSKEKGIRIAVASARDGTHMN